MGNCNADERRETTAHGNLNTEMGNKSLFGARMTSKQRREREAAKEKGRVRENARKKKGENR